MRRTFARITITAAATAGLVATTYVQALGLGEIDVSSNLNQRFTATIPLTEISAEDLETVTVSLAPNEAFDNAGIERAEYLSTLDFQIRNDQGRPRVVVSSQQIAREPVLNLLVQARWSGGKIVRDYTVLLDPPEVALAPTKATPPKPVPAPVIAAPAKPQPAKPQPPKPLPPPVAATPVVPPPPAPAPAVAAPAPPKPVVAASEFYETPAESRQPVNKPAPAPRSGPVAQDPAYDSATGSYGPVTAGETLWSIGTKVRPGPNATMDQVLLALAEANPVAIQRGTTVSKGTMLRVPSAERILSVPAAAAKAKLASLRAGKPSTTTGKPAPATLPVPPPPPAAAPAKPVDTKPIQTQPAVAAPSAPVPAATTPSPAPATPATAPAAPVVAAAPAASPAPATPSAEVVSTPSPTLEAPAVVVTEAAATTPATEPLSAAPTDAAPAAAAPEPPPAPAVAPAPAKSPLAQPLPETAQPGLLEQFGLPLGAGALLLLLAGGGIALARRKKSAPSKVAVVPAKVDAKPVTAAAPKLADTTRLSGAQTVATAATATLSADATQQFTQPVPTAPPAPAFAHDATLILEPGLAATMANPVKPSVIGSAHNDFDQTAQVHVETAHINLGDNDPLSEADFHLAYGLYDEAILLLKTTLQEQPQRTDVQVKLAETYFAAGRAIEFQDLAEDLKLKLPAGEWSKIAIMGAQICPDAELFQSAAGEAELSADFDLAFDEPAAPAVEAPVADTNNSIDFALAPMEPVAPTEAPKQETSIDASLLGELTPLQPPQPPANLDDDASIDFMLGQSLTPLGAESRLSEGKGLSFSLTSPSLSVDIPKLETPKPELDLSEFTDNPTLTPSGPRGTPLLSLQDLEVSITPRDGSVSQDDEMNTKLDLARAYVEMGDNDMAKSLLLEVQQQGNDRHQQEAASLLQRLPA